MLKTIEFFENKGLANVKKDDHDRAWYGDFLEFVKKEQAFSILMTPSGYGEGDSRWDTARICEFNEILGFYGLAYWYTWQVSMLGLGPIWMSNNESIKERTAKLLQEGEIFAFGLSEKEHGADLISSEVKLRSDGNGGYLASGRKYYIGNGNKAALVLRLVALKKPATMYSLLCHQSMKNTNACKTWLTHKTMSQSTNYMTIPFTKKTFSRWAARHGMLH